MDNNEEKNAKVTNNDLTILTKMLQPEAKRQEGVTKDVDMNKMDPNSPTEVQEVAQSPANDRAGITSWNKVDLPGNVNVERGFDETSQIVSSNKELNENSVNEEKDPDKIPKRVYSNQDVIQAIEKCDKDSDNVLWNPEDPNTNVFVQKEFDKDPITGDTTNTRDDKQPKEDTDIEKEMGKISVINNYDAITEVNEDEFELYDKKSEVCDDDATDRFSEASIRLEEKFECGYCSSRSVIGRCDQCIEYLCQKCLNRHERFTASGTHDVFLFQCAESMKIKKVVPAVGFCQMCRIYLCDKCVLYHQGFKKFRNHLIVRGTEMPVIRPKPESPECKPAKNRAAAKSTLTKGVKARSTSRLSEFSTINPMYQREPKLMWSEKKGYFFKWFQYE